MLSVLIRGKVFLICAFSVPSVMKIPAIRAQATKKALLALAAPGSAAESV